MGTEGEPVDDVGVCRAFPAFAADQPPALPDHVPVLVGECCVECLQRLGTVGSNHEEYYNAGGKMDEACQTHRTRSLCRQRAFSSLVQA